MNSNDKQELEQILEVIAPVFGQLINKAVLEALRQHSSENAETVVSGDYTINLADMLKIKDIGTMDNLVGASNGILSKPTQEEHLSLVGEFDADKWAKLYIRTAPPQDVDTMRAWFANAIMAGFDHNEKRYREKHKRMGQSLDIQGSKGNCDSYMLGMFNGMEHMMAIMEDREPQFRSLPEENKSAAQTVHEVVRDATDANVWAQAYNAAFNYTPVSNPPGQRAQAAAAHADLAVKAFRERYK
jgi:hypothetical protein